MLNATRIMDINTIDKLLMKKDTIKGINPKFYYFLGCLWGIAMILAAVTDLSISPLPVFLSLNSILIWYALNTSKLKLEMALEIQELKQRLETAENKLAE